MKIKNLRIRNFKSLLDVSMEDIGKLTIITGENGSGKTNILEILNHFFNDFLITGGPPSPVFQDHDAWYLRRTRSPIDVTLTIELDNEKTENIFQNEELFEKMKKKYKEDYNKISICRQILKPNTPWITKYVKLGKLDIVVDDIIQTADDLNISLENEIDEPIDNFIAYFFHPQADQPDFSASRVLIRKKNAYPMDEISDSFVRDGVIPYEIISDVDRDLWLIDEDFKLIEKARTHEQIERYLPKEPRIIVTSDIAARIGDSIQNLVKNKFTYIPGNRDVKATENTRVSFIDKPSIIDPFCIISDPNQSPENEEIYRKILADIELFIEGQLTIDSSQNEIRLWEARSRAGGRRFLLKNLGGGIQVIIGLIYQINSVSKGSIFGIEEPEIHLHPELSRKLFNLFIDKSNENQIIITTHLPIFIDQNNPINNWDVSKEVNKTKVKRVESKDDLIKLLDKIGARPSDRLYPNKVLLCCETERTVLSTLAENLRYNIDGVLIPLASDLDKRKIKIHADFVKDTQTTLILFIDEHGKENAEEAVSKGYLKEENKYVLDGTIEDYYPPDILAKVLNDFFPVEVDEEQLVKPIVESVQGIKGIPKKWKINVGRAVAAQWNEDIPEIIKDVLVKLAG